MSILHVCVFYTEIQDGRQKWQENVFSEKSPGFKNVVKIALTRTFFKIYVFMGFTPKFKMAKQKWRQNNFGEKSPVDSIDTLWVKNFVEIALSHTVSEINAFWHFTQKFKMAAKSGGKMIKVASRLCRYFWVKNFVEIALSYTVSEINHFCVLRRNSRWPKNGPKTIFGKSHQ